MIEVVLAEIGEVDGQGLCEEEGVDGELGSFWGETGRHVCVDV